ncbi:p01990-1L [African swine fever virus]|uniref:p01990-1L n=1 Tax=African swine fever virus TaxID=10497 RepID=A0A2Z5DG77_ASF|nr:p01990-1R [African swine fever virus]UYB79146.1 p01990-1 [Recombinant African swine fever virus]AXB49389.1 p01990-1L [African swine fever virus]AXB49390.1 p01990-1R [African swine fever virus]AXB49563.1 p01990-1L [African swine fever virus]
MNIYLTWFLCILVGNLILAIVYCMIDEVCDNIHIIRNVAAPPPPEIPPPRY